MGWYRKVNPVNQSEQVEYNRKIMKEQKLKDKAHRLANAVYSLNECAEFAPAHNPALN